MDQGSRVFQDTSPRPEIMNISRKSDGNVFRRNGKRHKTRISTAARCQTLLTSATGAGEPLAAG